MSEELEEVAVEVDGVDEAAAKAAEQGWAPKDQWRGDPDKWVDAETFLERGEKNNAILRERNDRLLREVSDLKRELRDSVRQFGEASRKAEERAYQKAIREIQQQQLAAVENGDTAMWQRLESERTSLNKEFEEAKKPPEPSGPAADPMFESWKEDNRWYESDIEATAYAEQIASVIARRHGLNQGKEPTRAFYDEIASEVKKKYPDRFRNVKRDAPSTVQGETQAGGKVKRGKSYADLPPEAKAACDKFVKQKLVSREDYVKDYFGE